MRALSQTQAFVAENVLLDARLALFHEHEEWLAIADLHFGFELSQRLAGRLVPFWGMDSNRTRLLQLVADYQPRVLILVGDLVHDRTAAAPLEYLLKELRELTEVVAIAGNHDRKLPRTIPLLDSFMTDGFEFHHGNCQRQNSARIQIIGHLHPCATLRDGAGLRLRFPAFVQQPNCWVLPAFSAWASGVEYFADERSQLWLCSPQRILKLEASVGAA